MKPNPWWHYQRSRVFALFRRTDRAVAELQTALRIDPSYVPAISSLGFLYGSMDF